MSAGYFVSLSPLDYQQEKGMKTGSQVCTGLTACPRTQLYKPHAELETAGAEQQKFLSVSQIL